MEKENRIEKYDEDKLFRKYLHDIKNMKTIDKEMLNNIRNMSHENKMEIIKTLNEIIETIIILVED